MCCLPATIGAEALCIDLVTSCRLGPERVDAGRDAPSRAVRPG